MTKQEEQTFLSLIKNGTIDALKSSDGQGAIVNAMHSKEGQEAIKRGALAAFESKEGKKIFGENFVEVYNDILLPTLENMSDDIRVLRESAVKREEFTKLMREKMLVKT